MESLDLTCLRGCLAKCPGLRIDLPTEGELALLSRLWAEGSNHQVSFIRTRDIPSFQSGGEYASMIESSDLVLPADQELVDLLGRKIAKGEAAFEARRIDVPLKYQVHLTVHRETEAESRGITLYKPLTVLSILLSAVSQRGGSVFLVGGKPQTLLQAEANLRSTFPGLRVVGRAPGDYRPEEEPGIVLALQKSTPDMVVVGSMVEEGELWIPRHMRYSAAGLFFYEHPIIEILAGRQRP